MSSPARVKAICWAAVLISVGGHLLFINFTRISFKEINTSPKPGFVFLGSILTDKTLLPGSDQNGLKSQLMVKDIHSSPYGEFGPRKPLSDFAQDETAHKVKPKMPSLPATAEILENKNGEEDIGIPLRVEAYKPLSLP